MYRDVTAPPLHARKLSPLLEKACAAAFWVGLPLFFVLHSLAEIRARILRAHAPRPLRPSDFDALFARLCREQTTRIVSYVEGINTFASGFEEDSCLVVITFANGDVVSVQSIPGVTDALIQHAFQAAKASGARIVEHVIAPSGLIVGLGVYVAIFETALLVFLSKPLALVFGGVVLATLLALWVVQALTRSRGK